MELALRPAIGRCHDLFRDASMVRRVPSLVDDDELRGGPAAVQFPSGSQWRLEIEAAVDETRGNVDDLVELSKDPPVAEPGIVTDVVRDESRKGQPERRIVESRCQV